MQEILGKNDMSEILLERIEPNDWNPNEMTEEEFAELVAEVEHLGKPPKPIILRPKDDGFEIVDGEHSFRALLQVGLKVLKPGWYEVENYDNFEAMRQTYKRNQHGVHDPIKQGRLFQRMMDEHGLSQRAIAKEIGVSEGTIRNSLEYAKAAEVRNDYAFSKLTVNQVRTYNRYRLPPKVADVWLKCGAKVEAIEEIFFGWDLADMSDLEPWAGILENITRSDFKKGIETLSKIQNARWIVDDGSHIAVSFDDFIAYMEEITKTHWGNSSPGWYDMFIRRCIKTIFRLIDGKVVPVVPLEEIHAFREGKKGKWKDSSVFEDGLKALARTHAPEEVVTQDVWHEAVEVELQSAPDFIREAESLGVGTKWMVHNLEAEGVPSDVVESAKRKVIETLKEKVRAMKIADDLIKQDEVDKGVSLQMQWIRYSPQKSFDDEIAPYLAEEKQKKADCFWRDKEKWISNIVETILQKASKHQVMGDWVVEGRTVLDHLRQQLEALIAYDFQTVRYAISLLFADSPSWIESEWLKSAQAYDPSPVHECTGLGGEVIGIGDGEMYCPRCGMPRSEMVARKDLEGE